MIPQLNETDAKGDEEILHDISDAFFRKTGRMDIPKRVALVMIA